MQLKRLSTLGDSDRCSAWRWNSSVSEAPSYCIVSIEEMSR